jgi:hypothetical protein
MKGMEQRRTIAQLNRDRLASLKAFRMSHGLGIFIDEIADAQHFNSTQPQVRRNGEEYNKKVVTVYFNWQTDNRLMAHIIPTSDAQYARGGSIFPRLSRLVIPEAGHRLYANHKDGYQANGGGYSKPFHILERMVYEAAKHIDVNQGVGHWQDFIKCEVIA